MFMKLIKSNVDLKIEIKNPHSLSKRDQRIGVVRLYSFSVSESKILFVCCIFSYFSVPKSRNRFVFCIFSGEKVSEKLENILTEDKVEVVYFFRPICGKKSHINLSFAISYLVEIPLHLCCKIALGHKI